MVELHDVVPRYYLAEGDQCQAEESARKKGSCAGLHGQVASALRQQRVGVMIDSVSEELR